MAGKKTLTYDKARDDQRGSDDPLDAYRKPRTKKGPVSKAPEAPPSSKRLDPVSIEEVTRTVSVSIGTLIYFRRVPGALDEDGRVIKQFVAADNGEERVLLEREDLDILINALVEFRATLPTTE